MEKIIITKKARKELNDKFGTTNVSKALGFTSNSQMGRTIRHLAMNNYNGIIINL